MRPIEAGTNTLHALKELESIHKISHKYSEATLKIALLEVATLKDALIHTQQLLHGRFSDKARHLWYTFAHLAFAACVPFALIYPAVVNYAARNLHLVQQHPPKRLHTTTILKVTLGLAIAIFVASAINRKIPKVIMKPANSSFSVYDYNPLNPRYVALLISIGFIFGHIYARDRARQHHF
ncbi:MAG: hypothetical protein Q8K75_04905 [Chlamydiales bacterium]|nr:hypothetical protein [Chlamydiales bacterium]